MLNVDWKENMIITLAKLYLWLLLAANINGAVVSESAVCVPRLDYDINLLQKMINLENKYENLERKLNENIGIDTVKKGKF